MWYDPSVSKKKRRKPTPPSHFAPDHTTDEPEAPVLPKVPERLASPFRDALSGLKKQMEDAAKLPAAAKPKPVVQSPSGVSRKLGGSATFSADDKSALSLAMQGVK